MAERLTEVGMFIDEPVYIIKKWKKSAAIDKLAQLENILEKYGVDIQNLDYILEDYSKNQGRDFAIYKERAIKYDKYMELLEYTTALICKEIPKYRQKEIGEDILHRFTIIKSNMKFNPKTFGEIQYVDKILDMPENEKLKLKAVQIAKFWEEYEKKDEEINNLKKEVEILKKQLNSKKRQKFS